jgi:hypothetical protein
MFDMVLFEYVHVYTVNTHLNTDTKLVKIYIYRIYNTAQSHFFVGKIKIIHKLVALVYILNINGTVSNESRRYKRAVL